MGKGTRIKAERKKEYKIKTPDIKNPDQILSGMTEEERVALIGTRLTLEDGRVFEIKESNKDLGDGDIIKGVDAVQVSTDMTLSLGENDNLSLDWNPKTYLDFMYDQFFDAVQFSDLYMADKAKGQYEGKIYTEEATFEEFCNDALGRVVEQKTLMKQKLGAKSINSRQYGNVLEVLERSEETLRKFLEGSIVYE